MSTTPVRSAARGSVRGVVSRTLSTTFYRNSLLILATQAVTSVVGYLFWALTARDSGPAVTGLSGSLVSAVNATALVASTGVVVGSIPLLAQAADVRARRADAVSACVAVTLLSLAGGVVLVTVVPRLVGFLEPAAGSGLALALVVLVVSTAVGQFIDVFALAVHRTPVMLWRGAIAGVARLPVFLLPGAATLEQLIWAYALATVAADVVALLALRPRGALEHLRRAIPSVWGRRRFYTGHHVTSLGAAGAVYLLPVVVLSRLGPEAAGYFYPTWLLGALFFTVSPAVANAYMARSGPAGSALHSSVRSAVVLVLVLLAVPLLVVAVAPGAVLSLLGPGYAEQGRVLLWVLALSAVPDAVTNIAVAALRVQGRLGTTAVLNTGMSVLALVAAVPLLAWLGIAGGGVAWLLAQTAGALAVPFLLRRPRVPAEG